MIFFANKFWVSFSFTVWDPNFLSISFRIISILGWTSAFGFGMIRVLGWGEVAYCNWASTKWNQQWKSLLLSSSSERGVISMLTSPIPGTFMTGKFLGFGSTYFTILSWSCSFELDSRRFRNAGKIGHFGCWNGLTELRESPRIHQCVWVLQGLGLYLEMIMNLCVVGDNKLTILIMDVTITRKC